MRLSDNLGSHPVSVVPAEGMTFEMEKYFKRVDPNSGMKADRILEFNADHPIFAKLQIAVAQDEKKAEDLVKILYTQALLMADLPGRKRRRIYRSRLQPDRLTFQWQPARRHSLRRFCSFSPKRHLFFCRAHKFCPNRRF